MSRRLCQLSCDMVLPICTRNNPRKTTMTTAALTAPIRPTQRRLPPSKAPRRKLVTALRASKNRPTRAAAKTLVTLAPPNHICLLLRTTRTLWDSARRVLLSRTVRFPERLRHWVCRSRRGHLPLVLCRLGRWSRQHQGLTEMQAANRATHEQTTFRTLSRSCARGSRAPIGRPECLNSYPQVHHFGPMSQLLVPHRYPQHRRLLRGVPGQLRSYAMRTASRRDLGYTTRCPRV